MPPLLARTFKLGTIAPPGQLLSLVVASNRRHANQLFTEASGWKCIGQLLKVVSIGFILISQYACENGASYVARREACVFCRLSPIRHVCYGRRR